jgi:anthranilate/para-aminobenzoate synthase component II
MHAIGLRLLLIDGDDSFAYNLVYRLRPVSDAQ